MDIEYLREFERLAQSPNFHSVASEFYISQPTLSKHIASLEKECGFTLFERGGGGAKLTPLGRVYANEVQRVLDDYDGAMSRMRRLKGMKPLELRIGTYIGHSFIDDVVRLCISDLAKHYPLLEVKIVEVGRYDSLFDLSAADDGLFLVPVRLDDRIDGYHIEPLCDDPLVAVVPKTSQLAHKERISAAQLEGRLVHVPSRPHDRNFYHIVRSAFEALDVSCNYDECPWDTTSRLHEFDFEDGVFVNAAGMVYGLMPRLLRTRYEVVPFVEDSMIARSAAVWPEHPSSEAADLFLDSFFPRLTAALDSDPFDIYGSNQIYPRRPT